MRISKCFGKETRP